MIDYSQLGLCFKLYSDQVLSNRGLCYRQKWNREQGRQDLTLAKPDWVGNGDHAVDETIFGRAGAQQIFSVPPGVLWRPDEAKLRNLKRRRYFHPPQLVAVAKDSSVTNTVGATDQKALPPTPPPETLPVTHSLSITGASARHDAGESISTMPAATAWPAGRTKGGYPLKPMGTSTASKEAEMPPRPIHYQGARVCPNTGSASTLHERRITLRKGRACSAPKSSLPWTLDSRGNQLLLKLHVQDQVRYMEIGRTISHTDLLGRLRDKLNLQTEFVIKTKDKADMITIGDQEDLTVAILGCSGADSEFLHVSDHYPSATPLTGPSSHISESRFGSMKNDKPPEVKKKAW